MKRRLMVLTMLIVCLCFCVISGEKAEVFGETIADQAIIVKGTGEVYAAPDMAIISVGVETEDVDVVKAESDNSAIVNNLIGVLINNNIEKKNIRTSNYSIYKKHDYRTQSIIGYQVTNNIDITLYDLESAGSLISQLTKNGANVLRGISYSISDREGAEAEALEKALNSAKSKALILGGEDFIVSKIVEEGIYNTFPVRHDAAYLMSAAEKSNNVFAGECVVRVNLTVEFKRK